MHKTLHFDYLPPSKEAPIHHIMRALYQGGVIWGQSLEQNMKVLPPDMWGWVKRDENTWDIYWTSLSQSNTKIFANALVNNSALEDVLARRRISNVHPCVVVIMYLNKLTSELFSTFFSSKNFVVFQAHKS